MESRCAAFEHRAAHAYIKPIKQCNETELRQQSRVDRAD
eukprot:CAMPEP_0180658760 /NCGR_PEP_ID=MMETSP1037_2-20121125/57187_1 /TAXON_ID=632150 /ORGANISM="Azadinium spinosum, Strain 3D9" /LENGTH=38 /DNA_ID= /DNA_START= /DNA_END= /DNA_ORIENTATION=